MEHLKNFFMSPLLKGKGLDKSLVLPTPLFFLSHQQSWLKPRKNIKKRFDRRYCVLYSKHFNENGARVELH